MPFTSERVSRGHPEKICDQISDAIVTDGLKHDKNARVAVECMIIIAGEVAMPVVQTAEQILKAQETQEGEEILLF